VYEGGSLIFSSLFSRLRGYCGVMRIKKQALKVILNMF